MPLNLEPIKQRVLAATKGPWKAERCLESGSSADFIVTSENGLYGKNPGTTICDLVDEDGEAEACAEFIATR